MIILQIDKERFSRILRNSGMSANQLSQNLVICRHPTPRTLTTWMSGGVVASRWRPAICVSFRLEETDLFDNVGHMHKSIMKMNDVTRNRLAKVTINESITRACVTNWKRGGGIEPDNLIALASFLGVAPVRLLSAQTEHLLQTLVGPTPLPESRAQAHTFASPHGF